MQEKKKKYGWSANGIVGLVFTVIGLLYVLIAGLLWYFRVGDKPEERWIFLYVFGGMGLIFVLVGVPLLIAALRRRARLRAAYEGGYYVMAKIAGLGRQTNISRGGAHPAAVECHWQDPATGVVHIYYSRNLYMDVRDLLTSDEVPVYMDRYNTDVGFVDIDAVLPKMEIHR